MIKKFCWMVLAAALVLGCESGEKKPETSSAPAAPVAPRRETGRFALQQMLGPARFWAVDAQTVSVESQPSKDDNGQDGKSVYWQALFASPARQKSVTYSWSGITTPGSSRSMDRGREDTFNPANLSTQPFPIASLRIDSDQAFAMAQQHGGKALLEKNPQQPVTYLLDYDPEKLQLRWHVIYGARGGIAPLTVIVDASNGQFVHKE